MYDGLNQYVQYIFSIASNLSVNGFDLSFIPSLLHYSEFASKISAKIAYLSLRTDPSKVSDIIKPR